MSFIIEIVFNSLHSHYLVGSHLLQWTAALSYLLVCLMQLIHLMLGVVFSLGF